MAAPIPGAREQWRAIEARRARPHIDNGVPLINETISARTIPIRRLTEASRPALGRHFLSLPAHFVLKAQALRSRELALRGRRR